MSTAPPPGEGPRSAVDRFDDAVDRWWDRWRGDPALDRLFFTASTAADHSLLWHTLGVARGMVDDDPRFAVELSLALGVESALVNGPVKSLFNRRRPVATGPRPYYLRTPRTTSFPSGHATAAMVAASLLSRRGGTPLWFGLGLVVATSRIHVRIHHASDVAGGLVIGLGLGAAARRILR